MSKENILITDLCDLYKNYTELIWELFGDSEYSPETLDSVIVDGLEPYLFREDELTEEDVDNLLELAKHDSFVRYIIINKVKKITEKQFFQLIEMTSVTDDCFFDLLKRDDIKDEYIDAMRKKGITNDRIRLQLFREGDYFSENTLHYIINHPEITETNKYMPYRYLKNTINNQLLINANIKEKYISEDFLNQIANNENLSPSIREEAFNIGVDIKKIENPTPNMAIIMYESVVDIIFNEEYRKNDFAGIKKYTAEKIMKEIYKYLRDSYILDFIKRCQGESNLSVDINNIIMDIARTRNTSDKILMEIYKLNHPTINEIIKFRENMSQKLYDFIKNDVDKEEKKRLFIKVLQTTHPNEDDCMEYIEAKDRTMMKMILAGIDVPKKINDKILEYAKEHNDNELLTIINFKSKCNLFAVKHNEFSYFYKKFIIYTMDITESNKARLELERHCKFNIHELINKQRYTKETMFYDIIEQVKNKSNVDNKIKAFLDYTYNDYVNKINTYKDIVENYYTSLTCFEIKGQRVDYNLNVIDKFNTKDLEKFKDVIGKTNEKTIELLIEEMFADLEDVENLNEFQYLVLKSSVLYNEMQEQRTKSTKKELGESAVIQDDDIKEMLIKSDNKER